MFTLVVDFIPPTFGVSPSTGSGIIHCRSTALSDNDHASQPTKDAPPPVSTFDLAPTAMFVTSSAPIQDSSRQLNCLINRESIVFVVTVGCDCVVSELKEEIQRKRAMGILKDVDPHTLELWKVSTIDESRCEVTRLTPTTGRH